MGGSISGRCDRLERPGSVLHKCDPNRGRSVKFRRKRRDRKNFWSVGFSLLTSHISTLVNFGIGNCRLNISKGHRKLSTFAIQHFLRRPQSRCDFAIFFPKKEVPLYGLTFRKWEFRFPHYLGESRIVMFRRQPRISHTCRDIEDRSDSGMGRVFRANSARLLCRALPFLEIPTIWPCPNEKFSPIKSAFEHYYGKHASKSQEIQSARS